MRSSRFYSICSRILRSSACQRRCGCRWRGSSLGGAPGQRAKSTQGLVEHRRCLLIRRRRRGPWRRFLAIDIAASSRCVTGIRRVRKRRVQSPNGAGRDRLSAALSAIFDHDDGFLACRLAASSGAAGANRSTRIVCCYPAESGFVDAIAELIRPELAGASSHGKAPRLLLTAHGLPKRIVQAGDPYPNQVEMTARAVVAKLAQPGLDWQVCYQSRVGPLDWIGPATDAEIRRAGSESVPLVVAPISFVSEHSETLVELDIDYRHLAESSGVPAYHRVATVGVEPGFIAALASLVRGAGPTSGLAACSAFARGCAVAGGRM